MKTTITLLCALLAGSNAGISDLNSCVATGNVATDPLLREEKCQDSELGGVQTENHGAIGEDSFVSAESSFQVEAPAPLAEKEGLGSDLGVAQTLDAVHTEAMLKRVEDAQKYMQEEVMKEPRYEMVRDMCENKHELCTFWAVLGECENNPGFMQVNCAPVCRSCEQIHVEARCPMDPDAVDALYPGHLNRMFENIVRDPHYQKYEPVVLSRPSYAPGDTAENATYKIGIWMVLFDNILSEEEAERMIELGGLQGYERSSDVGKELIDGTHEKYINKGRTSTNAVRRTLPDVT